MLVCTKYVWCPYWLEEGNRCPRTEVTHLWDIMWALEVKPGFSGKPASTFNPKPFPLVNPELFNSLAYNSWMLGLVAWATTLGFYGAGNSTPGFTYIKQTELQPQVPKMHKKFLLCVCMMRISIEVREQLWGVRSLLPNLHMGPNIEARVQTCGTSTFTCGTILPSQNVLYSFCFLVR